MAVNTVRAELHELVDSLPEADLPAARRYLQFLRSGYTDMMEWALDTAPPEDEPTSPDEDVGAGEAWQEYVRGDTVCAEDAKRLLLP